MILSPRGAEKQPRGTGRSPTRGRVRSRTDSGASRRSLVLEPSTDSGASRRSRSRSRSRTPPPVSRRSPVRPRRVSVAEAAAVALRAAIEDPAVRLRGEKFGDVRSFFEIVDTNSDGRISVAQLTKALRELGAAYPRKIRLTKAELARCADVAESEYSSSITPIDLERWMGGRVRERRRSSPRRPRRSADDAPSPRRVRRASARRLAHKVNEEILYAVQRNHEDLAAAFRRMDSGRTGSLSPDEFRRGMSRLTGKGMTRAQLDAVMGELDTNEDDRVDYGEFVSAIRRMDSARRLAREVTGKLRRSIRVHREGLFSVFDEMDVNGVLSVEEFQRGLRKHGIDLASSEMQELMQVLDQDGDATLDWREFMEAIKALASSDFSDEESVGLSDIDASDLSNAERRRMSQRRSRTRSKTRSRTRSRSPSPNRSRSRSRSRVRPDSDSDSANGSSGDGERDEYVQQLRNELRLLQEQVDGSPPAPNRKWMRHAQRFSGQWHVEGHDDSGAPQEEWLVLSVGKAGDVQGQCLAGADTGGAACSFEDGELVGDRKLRFFQQYSNGDRTEWNLRLVSRDDTLKGTWSGDCNGNFTARRCCIKAQTGRSGLVAPTTPGSASPRRAQRTLARRVAQKVNEEILDAVQRNHDDLYAAFRRMDTNNDGWISPEEFRRGMGRLTGKGLTQAQLDAVMGELDTNEDDRVDYGEFVSAIRRTDAARKFAREVTGKLRRSIRENREGLYSAFDEMDENGDGVLSVEEFQRGLRKHGIDLASSEMQELMQVLDQDGDATLDWREFMEATKSDRPPALSLPDDARATRGLASRIQLRDTPKHRRETAADRSRTRQSERVLEMIRQRLEDLDAFRMDDLFRPPTSVINAASEPDSDVQRMLHGLNDQFQSTSWDLQRTDDPHLIIALLYEWLARLPESPIPKRFFVPVKKIVDFDQQGRHPMYGVPSLVRDLPEPGQCIVRAVVELYSRVDPNAEDDTVIHDFLAPVLLHHPEQTRQPAHATQDAAFVRLLVTQLAPSRRGPARPATPARYGLERHSSVGFNTTGEVGYTTPRYSSPVRYGSPQAQTDKHPLTQCLAWCCAGLLKCCAAPLKCCDDGRK